MIHEVLNPERVKIHMILEEWIKFIGSKDIIT